MRLHGEEARQFVRDVKAGVSDVDLMKKYNISAKGLVFLKKKAIELIREVNPDGRKPSIKIGVSEILRDLKAGMDDDSMMEKYKVSARQLQRVFRKLIDAGYVNAMELSKRLCITKSQVTEALAEVENAVNELE
jgi:hypothetical protein